MNKPKHENKNQTLQTHLSAGQFLSFRSNFFQYVGIEVHGFYPHAHGLAGFRHSLHLLRDKARVLDVALQLLKDLRMDVVFVVVCQLLQEVGVTEDLLGTCPVCPVYGESWAIKTKFRER